MGQPEMNPQQVLDTAGMLVAGADKGLLRNGCK